MRKPDASFRDEIAMYERRARRRSLGVDGAQPLREGPTGFLFAPGDDDALLAALDRALAHPDFPAIGAAGLELAREFAWPKIAEITAACYRGVTRY
jgi:glycosyltransferase involved in cell wall biosynthesis